VPTRRPTMSSKLPIAYFWKKNERCLFAFPFSFADLPFMLEVEKVISTYNKT